MPGVVSFISTTGRTLPQPQGNADTILAALQPIGVSLKASTRDGILKVIREAASTGRIPDYRDGPCKGGPVSGGTGFQTQLGVATAQAGLQAGASAIKIGSKALNAIPVVGQIISSAISLLTIPFQHHAQAVKNEQAVLCAAVPDVQNFLAAVDQYVASGQYDHVTAVQEMEKGFAAWRQEVSGILQDTGGACNAACVYEYCFRAAIEKRKLDYQQAEATLSLAAKDLPGTVVNGVKVASAKLTDFLKQQSAVIKGGNYGPLISALLVGSLIVGSMVLFSRLGRASQ